MVQRYVEKSLGRAYPSSPYLATRFYPEMEYQTSQGHRLTSDGIIAYGDELIFAEVIGSRPRMIESAIRGDLGAFREDLEDKVLSPARQLDRVVRDFRTGRFKLDDFDGSDMRKAYPIVITFGSIPQMLFIWREIRRMLSDSQLLRSRIFAPLQVIDVNEMEWLEPLIASGHSLLDLLKDKLGDPWYRDLPMRNFLIRRNLMVKNQYLAGRLEDLMEGTRELLFRAPGLPWAKPTEP